MRDYSEETHVLASSPSPPVGHRRLSLRTAFTYNPRVNHGDPDSASPMTATSTAPTSLSSSPSLTTLRGLVRKHRFSGSSAAASSSSGSRSRSRSPFTLHSAASSLRFSPLPLRRRPSAVELALREERSRCDEDSHERQGLGLMEPRPVIEQPTPIGTDPDASLFGVLNLPPEEMERQQQHGLFRSQMHHHHQPSPFVMGGIFEVMEGVS
ncbi:hypothetical protein FQN54_001966 [Arachnomyces sp. PD_36]|nr:hypothetical protein FQN54_001966 [Arachnomyces sp. PD_36]